MAFKKLLTFFQAKNPWDSSPLTTRSDEGLQEAARDSSRASVDHWPFSLMPDSHCKVLGPRWGIRYFWYVLNFLVVRLHKIYMKTYLTR